MAEKSDDFEIKLSDEDSPTDILVEPGNTELLDDDQITDDSSESFAESDFLSELMDAVNIVRSMSNISWHSVSACSYKLSDLNISNICLNMLYLPIKMIKNGNTKKKVTKYIIGINLFFNDASDIHSANFIGISFNRGLK